VRTLNESIFSERELTLTFAMSSSVRLSSVTFLRPTQAIEIFGSVSTPFGTMATCDLSIKTLRRSSTPRVTRPSGLNRRGVAKCSDFDLSKAISPKRCKTGGKLVLITNRKSYDPRLVLKSVTLNNLERRNGSYFALFQRIY